MSYFLWRIDFIYSENKKEVKVYTIQLSVIENVFSMWLIFDYTHDKLFNNLVITSITIQLYNFFQNLVLSPVFKIFFPFFVIPDSSIEAALVSSPSYFPSFMKAKKVNKKLYSSVDCKLQKQVERLRIFSFSLKRYMKQTSIKTHK